MTCLKVKVRKLVKHVVKTAASNPLPIWLEPTLNESIDSARAAIPEAPSKKY